jgi:small GTP-binding protein
MEDSEILSLKVVVVGNSGCGKTAIITRWVLDSFAPLTKPTIGSNHERKRVTLPGSSLVDLCVWDTAGQEQFHSLMPLYARSAALAIVVAAITDESSFESIPMWIDSITAACTPRPPLLLAVNKMDLCDREQSKINQIHANWNASFGSIFFVSALTGESVGDLFEVGALEASKFVASNLRAPPKPAKLEKQQPGCC